MKSVLISIQPKWCELIANGKKTIEVRKTRPKIDTPFKCYIYCTLGGDMLTSVNGVVQKINQIDIDLTNDSTIRELNGKVIGEFVCDKITNFESEFWDDETFERIQEFVHPWDYDREYGERNYKTVTTNESDNYKENWLCKQSCVSWEELRKYIGTGVNDFFGWYISNLVIYDKPKELSEFYHYCGDNPDCDGCEAHYYSNTECGKEEYCCSVIEGCKPIKRPPQSWCYVEGIK